MAKKTTLEEQQRIVKMSVEQKMSQTQIAEVTGLTPGGVAGILHRHGIRSRSYGGKGGNRKYKLSREQDELLVERYASGDSCEAIGTALSLPWLVINRRLKELGVTIRPAGFQKGEAHHQWKGGVVQSAGGYLQELVRPEDPYYSIGQKKVGDLRYVLQHRLVMARSLGRVLKSYETVHHIDGDRTNNDLSNLQLRTGKHGKGVSHVCADCGSHNVVNTPLN